MTQFSTQIGGKFSLQEKALFDLKQYLLKNNVTVNFPEADSIIGEINGISITFKPTAEKTFYLVEKMFFQSIKDSSFHIVHNKFVEDIGYIGKSASVEIAYAILHKKPILFLYEPNFGSQVPTNIKKIILSVKNKIYINNIVNKSSNELARFLHTLPKIVDYHITEEEKIEIVCEVDRLIEEYKEIN